MTVFSLQQRKWIRMVEHFRFWFHIAFCFPSGKKDVPPPETWHAILQLTKQSKHDPNGYPTITQHLALLFNYQFEALPIINPYKSQTNNVDLSTKVAIESLPTQYYSHVPKKDR